MSNPKPNIQALQEQARSLVEDWHEGVPEEKQFKWACEAAGKLRAFAELPLAPLPGYVLVKAYDVCGRFADDFPGMRADCAIRIATGKPCEKCPTPK